MSLPYVAALVRSLLLGATSIPDPRISTRAPAQVGAPFILVRPGGNVPIDAAAEAHSPLVLVEAWTGPDAGGRDPECVTWEAATEAIQVLSRASGLYQGAGYRTRVVGGPNPVSDDSRGVPLLGFRVLVELRVHSP